MFDNICKFLAENFQEDFVRWLLGSKVNFTELKPTELSLEPIRADSLILLQSQNLVLHIEFQTKADQTIPFRMIDYRLRVHRRYPNKDMKQVVVYLKKTNSDLIEQKTFRLSKTYHEFEVIKLWEQPTEGFLNKLGLLPFAVLTQTKNPKIVLAQIAQTIEETEANLSTKSNLLAASGILAGLILNQESISKILRSDIMRESVIYQEILKEGEIKGKLEGEIKGEIKGKLEVAVNLLDNNMTIEEVTKLTGLSKELIQGLSRDLAKE